MLADEAAKTPPSRRTEEEWSLMFAARDLANKGVPSMMQGDPGNVSPPPFKRFEPENPGGLPDDGMPPRATHEPALRSDGPQAGIGGARLRQGGGPLQFLHRRRRGSARASPFPHVGRGRRAATIECSCPHPRAPEGRTLGGSVGASMRRRSPRTEEEAATRDIAANPRRALSMMDKYMDILSKPVVSAGQMADQTEVAAQHGAPYGRARHHSRGVQAGGDRARVLGARRHGGPGRAGEATGQGLRIQRRHAENEARDRQGIEGDWRKTRGTIS